MVVGDRLSSTYFTENKRPFHNFGNTIVRAFHQPSFPQQHQGYHDRIPSHELPTSSKHFRYLSRNFEIETEMTIHAIDKNMQVENVVVDYQ